MEQPQSGLRGDPVDGIGEGVLRASRETVLSKGVSSPSVEQGRLQALIDRWREEADASAHLGGIAIYEGLPDADIWETRAATYAKCADELETLRAALSVEAPAETKEQP